MTFACSYDGSFEGLLTLFAELFRRDAWPSAISRGAGAAAGLFAEELAVGTDPGAAELLARKISRRMSAASLRMVYHAFLSEAPQVEMLLFRYLSFGRTAGTGTDAFLTHDAVLPVHRLVRQVRHEAHRMKGFVRFGEISPGLFYAPIGPDFFILPLIAPHFAERFTVQDWIIHDTRRSRALFHHEGGWKIGFLDAAGNPGCTWKEDEFRELWKSYFREIAVEERTNRKLQKSKLPSRYRKYLTELDMT